MQSSLPGLPLLSFHQDSAHLIIAFVQRKDPSRQIETQQMSSRKIVLCRVTSWSNLAQWQPPDGSRIAYYTLLVYKLFLQRAYSDMQVLLRFNLRAFTRHVVFQISRAGSRPYIYVSLTVYYTTVLNSIPAITCTSHKYNAYCTNAAFLENYPTTLCMETMST